ncbi:MAG: hypothetical protein ABJP48_00170 [Erythrobacter sp.]
MSKAQTITDFLEQTPEGETRLYEAPIRDATEERFFRLTFNDEHKNPLKWSIGLRLQELP